MILPSIFADEVSADFEEAVRLSAESGAKGIEVRGKMFGRSVQDLTDEDVDRVRAIVADNGMRIAVIGSPYGKCSHDDPDEIASHQLIFKRMVQLSHEFDTQLIRGFAFWNPHRKEVGRPRQQLEEYIDQIVEFLRPSARLAESEGVRLCLELEGDTMIGTCADARQILDAVDCPALAVTWDVNNGWECGERPLPDGFKQIRDRIAHIHVKPNPAHNMQTVGDSDLRYKDVFDALITDGFSGWASIEHWGSPAQMLQGLRELCEILTKCKRS